MEHKGLIIHPSPAAKKIHGETSRCLQRYGSAGLGLADAGGVGGDAEALGLGAGDGVSAPGHEITPASNAIMFSALETRNSSTTAPSLSKMVSSLLPAGRPINAQRRFFVSLMWQSGSLSAVAR